jgi:hypothetical protein
MTDELMETNGNFVQVLEYSAFLTPVVTTRVDVPKPKPTIHRAGTDSGIGTKFYSGGLSNLLDTAFKNVEEKASYKIGPLFDRAEMIAEVKKRMLAIEVLHPETMRVDVQYDIKEYWIREQDEDEGI